MVKHALWLTLLASGCFEDHYRCTSDSQCDLGDGGRCELDGHCSAHDITCPTERRYGSHAGALAGQCVDERVVPANACAGGQAPANPEGCFASVCERLPACCEVAWIDACVQLAQEACELACDTRIAITATRGMVTERWDARLSDAWTFAPRTDVDALAWVAPQPGSTEPRLATATSEELVIGDVHIAVPPGRSYDSITSINFDRDGRDTIATTFSSAMGSRMELWKLDTLAARDMFAPGRVALTWGDANRDAFPDAIVKNGSQQFNFLHNLADETYQRRVSNQAVGNVAGGATPGAPPLRGFDWIDFNGDGELDLVVFGAEVRIHTNELGLGDAASRQLDCDPPMIGRPCSSDENEPNLEAASFGGTVVPTGTDPGLVITRFPGRALYRVARDGTVTPLPFPGDSCACTTSCTGGCPGPNCTCTYNCSTCVPVLAIVARDVDHDRVLDLIAIDARLEVYIATAASGYQWGEPAAIPTELANTFFSVDVSVTGAPIP